MHTSFGSEVKLECAVSDPMADCKWYKNGTMLEGTTGETDGHERTLHFPSISHEDEGEYECRYRDVGTKARVEVQGMHEKLHWYNKNIFTL